VPKLRTRENITTIMTAQRNRFPGFGVMFISSTAFRCNYNPSRLKNKLIRG
jgi:hypothetical protein